MPIRVALVLACLAVLCAAAPADARRVVLVATGEATTTCTIAMEQVEYAWSDMFEFTASTDCDVPVQQTAHAWLPYGCCLDTIGADGGVCSAFRTWCASGLGEVQEPNQYSPMRYEVTLVAPRGQGWVGIAETPWWPGPYDECSGVGTDNLKCLFVADLTTRRQSLKSRPS